MKRTHFQSQKSSNESQQDSTDPPQTVPLLDSKNGPSNSSMESTLDEDIAFIHNEYFKKFGKTLEIDDKNTRDVLVDFTTNRVIKLTSDKFKSSKMNNPENLSRSWPGSRRRGQDLTKDHSLIDDNDLDDHTCNDGLINELPNYSCVYNHDGNENCQTKVIIDSNKHFAIPSAIKYDRSESVKSVGSSSIDSSSTTTSNGSAISDSYNCHGYSNSSQSLDSAFGSQGSSLCSEHKFDTCGSNLLDQGPVSKPKFSILSSSSIEEEVEYNLDETLTGINANAAPSESKFTF